MNMSIYVWSELVKELSDTDLAKFAKQDEKLVLLTTELYSQSFINNSRDTHALENPILSQSSLSATHLKFPDAEFKPPPQEELIQEGLIPLEKYESSRTLSQSVLGSTIAKEEDPNYKEQSLRLQLIHSIQSALIRQAEQERRRVNNLSQPPIRHKPPKTSNFPSFSRLGISFCVTAIISLIEEVGATSRKIYAKIMKSSASLLGDLPSLSLCTDDPTANDSLDAFQSFLSALLRGEASDCTPEDSVAAAGPLLALALARGSLTCALSLVSALLTSPETPEFQSVCSSILPLLSKLSSIKPLKLTQRITMNWDPNKQGTDMVLNGDNLTVSRGSADGWGSQVSLQKVTAGVHYFEFLIKSNCSSRLLIGVAGDLFRNYNEKGNGAFCYTLGADGEVYINEEKLGNLFRYVQGDRFGVLVNMEDRNLWFFLNGRRQIKPPFGPLTDGVYLIVSMGGNNQCVSIVNEPEVPEEAYEIVGPQVIYDPAPVLENKIGGKDAIIGGDSTWKQVEEFSGNPVRPEDILESLELRGLSRLSQLSPKEIAVTVLAYLDRLNDNYFEIFNLSRPPLPEKIKVKLKKYQPLCLELNPEVLWNLTKILQYTVEILKENKWDLLEFQLCAWVTMSTLRLLRSHLFTIICSHSSEGENIIVQYLRELLYLILQDILIIDIKKFDDKISEKYQIETLTYMQTEVFLTITHSFDLFYPSEISKLDYINTILEDTLSSKIKLETDLSIQRLFIEKMSVPLNFYTSFVLDESNAEPKFEQFLDVLLKICYENSQLMLKGNKSQDSDCYLMFLQTVQKVIFSRAAEGNCKGPWQKLIVNYAAKAFSFASTLLQGLTDEEFQRPAKGTILESLVSTLLYSLFLSNVSIEEIAVLTPSLTQLVNDVVPRPITRDVPRSIRKCVEIYESLHPYNSEIDEKTFKIDSARRYHLQFDEKCETASEAHRLSLWKSPDRTEDALVGSWSLNAFPKELIVETSELYFEFAGDSELQSWGWKIIIEAGIEEEDCVNWSWYLRDSAVLLGVFLTTLEQKPKKKKKKLYLDEDIS